VGNVNTNGISQSLARHIQGVGLDAGVGGGDLSNVAHVRLFTIARYSSQTNASKCLFGFKQSL